MSIFDEKYRVVAVEAHLLHGRGSVSRKELTIMNPESEIPINQEDYPPGKLIALSDPSTFLLN